MSDESIRRSVLGQTAVAVSLVAAVACGLANDALASRSPAKPTAGHPELSARIAAIVDHVRLMDPALTPNLLPEQKIAQWRNR
jgi:hypothetical protein